MPAEHLAAALAPALIILAWLNWRGRPWLPVLIAVALGIVSAEAAGYVEGLLTGKPWTIDSFGMLFLFTTIVAGLVEELCKYAAFRVGPGRGRWFREEYDGILFAAAVSLGFAGWENVCYVREHGWDTAMVRAYTAVPAHAACGIIMGAFLGQARVRELHGWSTHGLTLRGVGLAVLFHGIYDMLAFAAMPLADAGLKVMVASAALWCIGRVRAARHRSPSYGGTGTGLPEPVGRIVARPAAPRRGGEPVAAALLGVLPGLGQAYNRDYRRAALMFCIFAVNVTALHGLVAFLDDPEGSVGWLASCGVTLALKHGDVTALLEQRSLLLGVAYGALLAWICVSAVDAWRGARADRGNDPVEGLGKSYLAHVLIILLVLFTPFLAGGGRPAAGEEGGYNVTWVENPTTIDGWKNPSEGSGDGQGEKEKEQRPGTIAQGDEGDGKGKSPKTSDGEKVPGDVATNPDDGGPPHPAERGGPRSEPRERAEPDSPSGEGDKEKRSGDPNATSAGVQKSYNQYLTSRFANGPGRVYFDSVPPNVWTVVHYTIDADGTLHDLDVVETSGTPDQARLALDAVNAVTPLKPLPEKVRCIEVTELFWSLENTPTPAGSLAERLSRLPDGRLIEVRY